MSAATVEFRLGQSRSKVDEDKADPADDGQHDGKHGDFLDDFRQDYRGRFELGIGRIGTFRHFFLRYSIPPYRKLGQIARISFPRHRYRRHSSAPAM